MGCSESRSNLTPEEAAIDKGEQIINLKRIMVQQGYLVMKRYGSKGSMTRSQLKEAARLLKVDMTGFRDPKSKVSRFFSGFKVSDTYSHEWMMVLALLLGAGSISEKANAFFSHMDKDFSGTITQQKYGLLLRSMIKVGLTLNAILGVGVEEEGFLTLDRIKAYTKNIEQIEQKAITSFKSKVFGSNDSITLEAFVSAHENQKALSQSLSASGLRQCLCQIYKDTPATELGASKGVLSALAAMKSSA